MSGNNRLKTVMAMHNIIALMIRCIRANPESIEILDTCVYVLANLAYDHYATMTQIIELGGIDAIFAIISRHSSSSFLHARRWNERFPRVKKSYRKANFPTRARAQ